MWYNLCLESKKRNTPSPTIKCKRNFCLFRYVYFKDQWRDNGSEKILEATFPARVDIFNVNAVLETCYTNLQISSSRYHSSIMYLPVVIDWQVFITILLNFSDGRKLIGIQCITTSIQQSTVPFHSDWCHRNSKLYILLISMWS